MTTILLSALMLGIILALVYTGCFLIGIVLGTIRYFIGRMLR